MTYDPPISPFPWYFVAIGGFLFASVIFLLIYWTVKRFRQIFSKRIQNSTDKYKRHLRGKSSTEPIIQRVNFYAKSTKYENSPKLGSRNRNESLFSDPISKHYQQQAYSIYMEEGELITVIDPLLNQLWSGTMSK